MRVIARPHSLATALLRALFSFTRSRFSHGRWNTNDQQQGCDQSICQEQDCKAQQLRQCESSPDFQRQRKRLPNQRKRRMGLARTTVVSGTRGKAARQGKIQRPQCTPPLRFLCKRWRPSPDATSRAGRKVAVRPPKRPYRRQLHLPLQSMQIRA